MATEMKPFRPQRAESGARPREYAQVARAVATLARYTFIEALRSNFVAVAAVVIVCVGALGQFFAELALTDAAAIRALSMAWILRVAAVFLLAAFAISTVVRDQNDKGLELLLALPWPRAGYLMGKWLGCAATGILLAFMFTLALALAAPLPGVAAWGLSLALEMLVVASAGVLCALTFKHVVGSLAAVAAFYALCRTMGALLAIGASRHAPADSAAFRAANLALEGIAALLPRLDMFTRSQWLADGHAPLHDLGMVFLQAAVATAVLLTAALIDLSRKSV